MEWASWNDFWAMGGRGLYVWGSYGVTLLMILIEVVLLRRNSRQAIQNLKRLKKWENLESAKPNPGFGEG